MTLDSIASVKQVMFLMNKRNQSDIGNGLSSFQSLNRIVCMSVCLFVCLSEAGAGTEAIPPRSRDVMLTVQSSAMPCSVVQCSAVQYIAVWCSELKCSAM